VRSGDRPVILDAMSDPTPAAPSETRAADHDAADTAGSPKVVVITGLSGAGRTTAAKVLEDLGYFVIDNLPPALLGRVFELAAVPGSTVDRIALVVDVRGRQFFGDLREAVTDLRRRAELRILFLESSDEALVKRYEAARRAHPLSGPDRITDGIARERNLLDALKSEADLIVDTSDTNVHQLRDRLIDAFGEDADGSMVVNVVSFGFKNGTPRDADLVLDVRFLPNPHWVEDLRPFTGVDQPVKDYVMGQPDTEEFLGRLTNLLDLMVPAFVKDGKRYLTIAVGCTGGKHRSVVLAQEIADRLGGHDVSIQVDHRDRGKE
jgi:RNase adapter protein RapZ